MTREEYARLRKGQVILAPNDKPWTIIRRWTRGHGGEVWTAIQSEGGRIMNKLSYELEDWSVQDG